MAELRIFIVEDEAIVADDFAESLKSMGYVVAGMAKSGEAALVKIPATKPDLVFMDIHLAGELDGITTATELHKTSDMPVIYLTAYADRELISRARLTGPYGYLIKPYDERELQTVIEMAWYKYSTDKKLRESEEKFRALTENTPDILFSTDMAGVITYISPQVNKYGFLEDEIIGKTLRTFIHPADIDHVEMNLSKELEKGAQFVSEFRIVDKWENICWFEERSFLRLDISGKPAGMYGILRDVTMRRQAKDAMDIANRKLNLMNQVTRHDILNTITGLLGCVDMAKATPLPEEKDRFLSEIRDLTRVIQNHISFTREYQEVGIHQPQWQNVNTILAMVAGSFSHSGIPFLFSFEPTGIFADPLLEKVFYNLVENAVRHGETLTKIQVTTRLQDKDLIICVEDDGVGVAAGEKKEIFKRGVGKNTGLGLFLTAEILDITGITIAETGLAGAGPGSKIRVPAGMWRFENTR